MMSYFARFNYTFADKYLIELTGRYDGSSRFTAKNRWGFFPSVSIGWRISEEHFFDPLKDAIDNLKIRASYGSLGNQDLKDYYPYASVLALDASYWFGDSKNYTTGIYSNALSNPEISWEKSQQFDFGLDITAFNTPKSLGEPVGTVKEIKGNSFTVAGLKQLNNGDGLVFFNRKGELEGFRVNRVEANRVFPLDMPQLAPKTPLYRNFDQVFDKLLAKPSAERRLSVKIEFLDNPFGFTLCMEDETGARIMLAEPFAKELARREQQDNIRTQLSKLGNTPFEASKVVVGLSENWFVPSSLLADMRRRGVEMLLEARRARYPRETVKRVQPSVSIPFPERQLTYLGNVANGKARSFYQDHGVEQIDPAFELSPRKDVPLMFTKHCLRYSMGWCPTYQKDKSPYKEPYYLLYKDTCLRLQFDCKHCQMLVFES